MARGNRYDVVKDKVSIGDKSHGWKCVALYTSFNLWTKEARTKGYMIRECFPKNSIPNTNANYEVILK